MTDSRCRSSTTVTAGIFQLCRLLELLVLRLGLECCICNCILKLFVSEIVLGADGASYKTAHMDIRQLLVHDNTLEKLPISQPSQTQDWQYAIQTGNLALLETSVSRLQRERQVIPVQAMLRAALQGDSGAILSYLFNAGARIDSTLDTICIKQPRRPIYFFQVLVDQGWPSGPRGVTNNLSHGRDVVELLLKHGRIVGVPCLRAAVLTGDVEVLAILIQNIDPRAKVPDMSDYEKAMNNPSYWISPSMFSEEPSLTRIIDQASLLPLAALHQELDMVQYLLGLKASVDLTPLEGQCPDGVNGCALHKAVSGATIGKLAQPDIVFVLLQAGADPLLKDELGRTALEINEHWGHPETKGIIQRLLTERMGT